jgi:hypothetical protein
VNKNLGEAKTKAILVLLIDDLVNFFSIGKSMDDNQCAQTVDLIMRQYYYLNIADIRLCFDRIKDGTYGKLYDRIDGQIILMAMKEYSDGRLSAAEYASGKKHEEVNDEPQEEYIVKIDGKMYLREIADGYEEVDRKDLATTMSWERARSIKLALKGYEVTAERKNKSDIGLIEWMKQQRPDIADNLIARARRRDEKLRELREKMAQINAMDISDYEKSCLTRDELGMERETEAQYKAGMLAMYQQPEEVIEIKKIDTSK